nr:hypothetical protein [Tanacetum cinerariifolium]
MTVEACSAHLLAFLSIERIEAVDSDGHLRSCPWLGVVDGGRRTRSYDRLTGPRRIRVGSWNVGSLMRGYLNGRIGAAADGYTGVHGGFGFGDRNEEGCTILEFATAHELVVANSFFKKSDAHLITFQSRGHNTQIDYLLVHRDVLFERRRHRREATGRPRILWKNLKWEAVETFRAAIMERLAALEEIMSASGADQMWNTLARVMKDAAKESLGVANETTRTHSTHKESWWFCEEVQIKVTLNQSRFKELLSCREGNQEDIDLVKERADVGRAVGSSSPHMHYECYYSRINQGEVKTALKKIGINKAVGPDQIPIEAWRSLKDEGVKWLGLGSVIHRSGRIDDVAHRIREGWTKWKAASRVLCDSRIPLKLKGKFYKVAIRPAMLYGSECWPITKAQATRVEVAELRMLRLRWFWHVKRRPRNAPVRRVKAMEVEGSRRRGRPKLRWKDRLKMDMKELLLFKDMTSDRNAWKDRIRISRPKVNVTRHGMNADAIRTVGKAYVADALTKHATHFKQNYVVISIRRTEKMINQLQLSLDILAPLIV